ncbi:MAG: SulP family inorganic anion transporter [Syntrophobacterales bacterium]|nr:SulP family inorganic anion transporter [Syntrophobacterales bacterium]
MVVSSPDGATAMLRLDLLRNYKMNYLPGDVLAGLLIFMVTIPAALAYSQMAGLNVINGLYGSLLALAIYGLFGTSRQLIIGSEATVAILVATSLATFAAGADPARYLALVMMQAIMVGIIQVVGGLARVGFVSDFIPKSVVIGFLNGMALIIILSQVSGISGIDLKQEDFFLRLWELGAKIHTYHPLTLYMGLACLLGLVLLRFIPKLPEAVFVMVLAAGAVIWWDLGSLGIKTVGAVPAGLPWPALPKVSFEDILNMLPFSVGLALVSYVDTAITARAFATKGRYRIAPNQELIALGLANVGAGLCQGFALGGSQSRTVVNDQYGGRTQFAGFFAAILLALFLLYSTDLLKQLPIVALSAIIVVAGFKLFSLREVITAWRTRPASAYFSLATTAAVLIAGLMIGILVAVVFAIILVLHRLARPHETITRPPVVPGLMIYRFGAPIYFFNAAYFARRVRELIDSARPQVTFFLINAEAIADMDVNASEMLDELHNDLKSRGIVLGICNAKGHFRTVFKSTRFHTRAGFNLYPSIGEVLNELKKEKSKEDREPEDES